MRKLKARFLVRIQAFVIKLQLVVPGQVPFLLYVLGMVLVINGIRMIPVVGQPAAWIFGGGVIVHWALMSEKNESQSNLEEEIKELEKIRSSHSRNPIR